MSTEEYLRLKQKLENAQAEFDAYCENMRKEKRELEAVGVIQTQKNCKATIEARREQFRKLLDEAPDILTTRQVAELVDIPVIQVGYFAYRGAVRRNADGSYLKSEIREWLRRAKNKTGYQPGDNEPGCGFLSFTDIERIKAEEQMEAAGS